MDRILYYDCTNYYFEIEQEDGDKNTEKAKPSNPIIQWDSLQMVTNTFGFLTLSGNQNERNHETTFKTKILQQFGCDKFIY